MAQFVLIFSTVVRNSIDQDHIKKVLSNFKGIMEWNHDLEDADKILRVVCNENICKKLLSALQKAGVSAFTLAVFQRTNSGPEQIL